MQITFNKMGWNLQTWLWGTVILCGLSVFVSDTLLEAERRRTYVVKEPLEWEVKIFENRMQKNHGLRLVCGYLSLFCVITYLLFF